MKRTPLSKTGKKHTNEWHRKKGVENAKLIAKHLGGYICNNPGCVRTAQGGFQMHGSHILPEGKFHRMSVIVKNIMCQCAVHHMEWHEHPLAQHAWFEQTYPGRFQELLDMEKEFKKEYIKPDYQKINEELKTQYKSMIN